MRFFALLFLGYANLSLALGLGDITLKSHLGEPLSVSISITDVEKSPDTSCFAIKDNSDVPAFRKATPTFKQSGDGYKLNISTHDPIHEPIINLLVAFNCEPNLSRQYVLLLDPAEFSSATSPSDSQIQPEIINPKKIAPTKAGNVETDGSLSGAASTATIKKKKTKRKKIATASEIDRRLAEAYTGKSQDVNRSPEPSSRRNNSADAPQTRTPAATSKPQLIISGGSTSSDEHGTLPNPSLRLETQIDFSRAVVDTPVNSTDALDEITVMANRLAHMEKQIASLQNKNIQLQNEAKKAKEDAKSANSLLDQLLSWSKYLLIFIGIISLFISGEWIRRKAIRNKLDREEAIWFNENRLNENHNDPAQDISSIFASDASENANESLLNDLSFSNTSNGDYDGSQSQMITEHTNDDNVLENADVFIAHDRPALAIQLLQNHLVDFPSESPKIWLKLLSLIAKDGSEAEYEQAVTDCKQFFNIKMPSYAEAGSEDESSIEDYPHILARLEGVWGSPYAVGFLSDLIYNQQSQPREGFGRGTFDDLFFLKKVAETLSANNANEQTSFYKPTKVKPKLENVAFNQDTFGNSENSGQFLQPDPENETDELNLSDKLFSTSLENSAFQQIPSYEVDLLTDLDSALTVKNTPIEQKLLNSELAPRSIETIDTVTSATNDDSLQAEEIQFPAQEPFESETSTSEPHAVNDDEDIFNIKEENTVQDSNLIEWDLPEEERPKKN